MNAGEINYELKELRALWEQFKRTGERKRAEAIKDDVMDEADRKAGMVTALTHCIGGIDSLIRRIDGQ